MLLNLPPVPHTAPFSVLGLHNMTSPTLSPPSIPMIHPAISTSPTSTTITKLSRTTVVTHLPSLSNLAYFSTVSDFSNEPSPMTSDHPTNLPSPVLSLINACLHSTPFITHNFRIVDRTSTSHTWRKRIEHCQHAITSSEQW